MLFFSRDRIASSVNCQVMGGTGGVTHTVFFTPPHPHYTHQPKFFLFFSLTSLSLSPPIFFPLVAPFGSFSFPFLLFPTHTKVASLSHSLATLSHFSFSPFLPPLNRPRPTPPHRCFIFFFPPSVSFPSLTSSPLHLPTLPFSPLLLPLHLPSIVTFFLTTPTPPTLGFLPFFFLTARLDWIKLVVCFPLSGPQSFSIPSSRLFSLVTLFPFIISFLSWSWFFRVFLSGFPRFTLSPKRDQAQNPKVKINFLISFFPVLRV